MSGAGDQDDGDGKVVRLRSVAAPADRRARSADAVVPFFPAKLKSYYLDVLAKYKDDQSTARGKAVGWLTIRDEIMKKENAEQAVREGVDPNAAKNKSRSDALTLDDLKGWFKAGKTHLPSDFKFQFIDRFVRGLRLRGEIDRIELAAAEAQKEYFREALSQYYRPDWSFITLDDKGHDCPSNDVSGLLSGSAFGSVCNFEGDGSDGFFELVACTWSRAVCLVDVVWAISSGSSWR